MRRRDKYRYQPCRHRSHRPPRRQGGNIDCKALTVGASLFLPIHVPGALFSVLNGRPAGLVARIDGAPLTSPSEAACAAVGGAQK